jgi:hypothetical protein
MANILILSYNFIEDRLIIRHFKGKNINDGNEVWNAKIKQRVKKNN